MPENKRRVKKECAGCLKVYFPGGFCLAFEDTEDCHKNGRCEGYTDSIEEMERIMDATQRYKQMPHNWHLRNRGSYRTWQDAIQRAQKAQKKRGEAE